MFFFPEGNKVILFSTYAKVKHFTALIRRKSQHFKVAKELIRGRERQIKTRERERERKEEKRREEREREREKEMSNLHVFRVIEENLRQASDCFSSFYRGRALIAEVERRIYWRKAP